MITLGKISPMKRSILTFLTILAFQSAKSQTESKQLSLQEHPCSYPSSEYAHRINLGDDEAYELYLQAGQYSLAKIPCNKGTKMERKNIKLPAILNSFSASTFLVIDKNIYLIGNSSETDTLKRWACKLDLATSEIKEYKLLYKELDEMPGGASQGNKPVKRIEYKMNEDNTLLVYDYGWAKKVGVKFKVLLFNKELKMLWSHEFKNIPGSTYYMFKNITYKDPNNVLLSLVSVPSGKLDDDAVIDANYIYSESFYHISSNGTKITEIKPDLSSKINKSGLVAFDNKNNVVLSGFYSDNINNQINGAYYFSYNGGFTKPTVSQFSDFTKDFKTKIYASLKKNKSEPEGNVEPDHINIALNEIMFDDNNNAILVGEEKFYDKANNGNSFYIATMQLDLVVAKIDASGKMVWSTQIDKNFLQPNGSAISFIHKNKPVFIFREEKGNFTDVEEKEKMKLQAAGYYSALPAVVVINEDGTFKKEIIPSANLKCDYALFYFNRYLKTADNKYYINVGLASSDKVGMFELKFNW